jgi:phosphate starvation-inducible PhoH-like protein
VEAIEVVGKIEGIELVYFDERDVVRHSLVQRIIKAYDEYSGGHTGGNSGRSASAAGSNRPNSSRENVPHD